MKERRVIVLLLAKPRRAWRSGALGVRVCEQNPRGLRCAVHEQPVGGRGWRNDLVLGP
jgi:hypothetical protein